MGPLRSSTVFRLLCAAIGILSLGLLGMVGVMVYPSLASGDQTTKAPVVKPKVRQMVKAKEVPVEQNLAQLSEFLYPPPKADMGDIWSHATDSFHDWSLIGLASEGENKDKGYVFLQRKDGKTMVLGVGQSRPVDGVVFGISQIHDGMVQISCGNDMGALKRPGAIASLPGQPGPSGGPAMGGVGGSSTFYGAGVPATPTLSAPPAPPTSRVTFRGTMAGPPAATTTPTPSTPPAAGPGSRQMRMRGGRNGNGNSTSTNGGGSTGGASAPATPQQ